MLLLRRLLLHRHICCMGSRPAGNAVARQQGGGGGCCSPIQEVHRPGSARDGQQAAVGAPAARQGSVGCVHAIQADVWRRPAAHGPTELGAPIKHGHRLRQGWRRQHGGMSAMGGHRDGGACRCAQAAPAVSGQGGGAPAGRRRAACQCTPPRMSAHATLSRAARSLHLLPRPAAPGRRISAGQLLSHRRPPVLSDLRRCPGPGAGRELGAEGTARAGPPPMPQAWFKPLTGTAHASYRQSNVVVVPAPAVTPQLVARLPLVRSTANQLCARLHC